MANKAVPIFKHVGNKHPELVIETRELFTVAIYAIHRAIVPFETQLGNICFFAGCQG